MVLILITLINYRSVYKKTTLFIALENNDIDFSEFLIKKRASLEIVNQEGLCAYDIIFNQKNKKLINLIK